MPPMSQPATDEARAAALVAAQLDDAPLTILFRIRNNRVDYSILNRPEPNLSNISDAVLMAAILHAGKRYSFKRTEPVAENERVQRSDGKAVTYKESIEIDFESKTIEGSMPYPICLNVLSIIVQNLAANVVRESERKTQAPKPLVN